MSNFITEGLEQMRKERESQEKKEMEEKKTSLKQIYDDCMEKGDNYSLWKTIEELLNHKKEIDSDDYGKLEKWKNQNSYNGDTKSQKIKDEIVQRIIEKYKSIFCE